MLIAILAAASGLWPIPTQAPAVDQVLMRAYYTQNEVCRGYDDAEHIDRACPWRDDTARMLRARGWEWSDRYGWRRATARVR